MPRLAKESVASKRRSLAGGARKEWQMVRWSGMQAPTDNVQGVIQNAVDETGVCAATRYSAVE